MRKLVGLKQMKLFSCGTFELLIANFVYFYDVAMRVVFVLMNDVLTVRALTSRDEYLEAKNPQ